MIIDTDNFSWAINQISKHDLVFVDLETTGLEPFNGDKICGVAVMVGEDSMYFPFRHMVGANLPKDYMGKLFIRE